MTALSRWGPVGSDFIGTQKGRGDGVVTGLPSSTIQGALHWPVADKIPQATLSVVDMELGGLISPRMRHIIKRYVKRVGLHNIKVEHLCDGGPATVRLVVTGVAFSHLTEEQARKLEYLESAIAKSLTRPINGIVPHPSQADPEFLRLALSEIEPSMKRVFYSRA